VPSLIEVPGLAQVSLVGSQLEGRWLRAALALAKSSRRAGLNELGTFRAQPAEGSGHSRVIGGQRKITEVEPGPHRASDQSVTSRGTGSLPPAGGHVQDRSLRTGELAESLLSDCIHLGWRHPEVERRSLVEMPDLVGADPVPAADAACWQKEVNGCERGPGTPPVTWLDQERRAKYLAVVTPLRMGNQAEGGNKSRAAIAQGRPDLPTSAGLVLSIEERNDRVSLPFTRVFYHCGALAGL
jgi:hypothetical protein